MDNIALSSCVAFDYCETQYIAIVASLHFDPFTYNLFALINSFIQFNLLISICMRLYSLSFLDDIILEAKGKLNRTVL